MQTSISAALIVCLLVWSSVLASLHAAEQPPGLLLTWQDDPTTTMIIDWQVDLEHNDDVAAKVLHLRPLGESEWQRFSAQALPFPHSPRSLRRVALTDLQPDTAYEFRVGGFTRVYRFQTMPQQLDDSLTFVTGGDTLHRAEWMEEVNRVAMEYDPAFIVWAGDLAYADGEPGRIDRWYTWFDVNLRTLIHDDGRVVPIVVGIGNHEVRGGYVQAYGDNYRQENDFRRQMAPFFFSIFAFPGQPGYASLRFGDYFHLCMLDSDHANPIPGAQTQWLEQDLAKAQADGVRHIIPFYHVPAYPSVRPFDTIFSQRVREHWLPVFEQHGVRLVFEAHDHAYKRTPAIRQGEKDPEGITFIGDGAWGVGVRPVHDVATTWYLASAASRRHALVVELRNDAVVVQAIADDGEQLDQVTVPASR